MKLDIPEGDFAGYIFDLDGTLVDTMPLHYQAWNRAMQGAGLSAVLDEDLFYSLGGVPSVEVAELFARHYEIELDAAKVTHEKELHYLGMVTGVKVIEPVASFARRIAGTHPRAIATGGLPEIALPAMEAAGLTAIFDIIITPRDVAPGRGKPHPDMFLLAAKKMGVSPDQVLVFEDAEPGIRAARAAGMQVAVVPSRVRVG